VQQKVKLDMTGKAGVLATTDAIHTAGHLYRHFWHMHTAGRACTC